MATYNLNNDVTTKTLDPLFPHTPPAGSVKAFEFDYAAPAGNEDATINFLQVGDLVYSTGSGQIKKLKESTANATLKAPNCLIGIVVDITDQDQRHNSYNEAGKTFTADGGVVLVMAWKNVPVYTKKAFIHKENAGAADTRVQLDLATHAGSSAVLEGLVKAENLSSSSPSFIFV